MNIVKRGNGGSKGEMLMKDESKVDWKKKEYITENINEEKVKVMRRRIKG